jgi:hypothetical protein
MAQGWATKAIQILVFVLLSLLTSAGAQTGASNARAQSRVIELTDAEREFVRESKGVNVALAGNTPPLYTLTADQRIVGMIGDYLDWVGERTGLKFVALSRDTFQETLDDAAAGKADVLPLFALDPSRRASHNRVSTSTCRSPISRDAACRMYRPTTDSAAIGWPLFAAQRLRTI